MKPSVARILLLLFVFLWCGVGADAQTTELPLRKSTMMLNTTRNFARPTPIAFGVLNSSTTAPLQPPATLQTSVETTNQTIVLHHKSLSIKGTKTMITSSATLIPTTRFSSSPATRTIANSSFTVIPTTQLPPNSGPMGEDLDSKLSLIIGCVVAAVIVLFVVALILYRRKRKCKRRKNEVGYFSTSHGAQCNNGFEPGRSFVVRAEHVDETHSTRFKSVRGTTAPPAVFYNTVAEEDPVTTYPTTMESSSKDALVRPGLAKKIITTQGGVVQIDDIVLQIGAGCLAKDTEITLIKDDQNFAFKSLLDLGLVDAAPRVVEFLPDGLKFVKPADLTIRFEKTNPASELFILHGCYNRDFQRTVWELVTNDIEDNRAGGFVNMKINGFCFYSYILSTRGRIAHLLSHLNNSFACRAYALYRRLPSMPTIDIAVVFVSEFVELQEGDAKELKVLYEEGYVKGERGSEKRVHTNRRLGMSVKFPGIESSPFQFKIDVPLLDTDGFVVDHFKAIAKESPASGTVEINELHRSLESKLLWSLNVHEMEEKIEKQTAEEYYALPDDPEPEVVRRTTKLTNVEISRLSRVIGVDWDSLAGLMNISYPEREEIRLNHAKYPNFASKAERIFALFNVSEYFGRHILEKCVEELGRHDVKKEMLSVETEEPERPERPRTSPPTDIIHEYENDIVQLRNTPLSSREMHRLSRRLRRVDWESLAGLMDIANETRDNIKTNTMYTDEHSKAEKIISIINHKEDFSREKLAECLQGIDRLDLMRPITTGQWRSL